MSQVNSNVQSVNNTQTQNTAATQQATQADNKSVQEFNKLLNGKKVEPGTERLFKKSEKMLTSKNALSTSKEQLTPEMKLSLLNDKQKGQNIDGQLKDSKAFTHEGVDLKKSDSQNLDKQKSDSSMPSAENLYASLNQNALNTNAANAQVQSTQSSQAPFDASKVQELADRILVATKSDGSNEVRLTLSDKALAGTEVIINKSLDNQLTVRFETTNANSFQTLVAAQDALKSTLENSNSNVRVEVSQEKGNPQGESRGKREYNPEDEQEA